MNVDARRSMLIGDSEAPPSEVPQASGVASDYDLVFVEGDGHVPTLNVGYSSAGRVVGADREGHTCVGHPAILVDATRPECPVVAPCASRLANAEQRANRGSYARPRVMAKMIGVITSARPRNHSGRHR